MSLAANSTAPMLYQWQRNGADLDGATNATLSLINVQMSQADNYAVRVSNSYGSVLSAPATLTVLVRVIVLQQPQSQTVAVGDTVTFSITYSNTASLPITNRWQKTTPGTVSLVTNVLNAYTSSFTLTNIQTSDAGTYRVVILNGFSASFSSSAVLTVLPNPRLRSPVYGSNGFQFQLTGPAGTYVVEASTNLMNWVALFTTDVTNGPVNVLDPSAANFPWRFYRARTP